MKTPALCPYCSEPLRFVEEFFGEWGVVRTEDGLRYDVMPKFDGGRCRACGKFVDPAGIEGKAP